LHESNVLPTQRQNLLHRNARHRRRPLGRLYQKVFGWNIRQRGDGSTSFDDTTGQVSGAFRLGRPPNATPGFMIYIMVDSVAAAMEKVTANGCEIVQPIGGDPGETTARFRDPGGNVVGLYQEPEQP